MRMIAALIMTSSLAVLIRVIHEALVISVIHPPGLTNPTLHFGLKPDVRDLLFAMLLIAAISAYGYATIAWTERKLAEIRLLLAAASTPASPRQPAEVRRLKDAIRSGDLGAVRRHAKRTTLQVIDEHFLTPMELADLYENQPVIDVLRAEMLKHAKPQTVPGQAPSPPSSQFALRRTADSPR